MMIIYGARAPWPLSAECVTLDNNLKVSKRTGADGHDGKATQGFKEWEFIDTGNTLHKISPPRHRVHAGARAVVLPCFNKSTELYKSSPL